MSDYEWEEFCEEIDTAMKPANRIMMISLGFFGLVFITFIISFIVTFVSFGSGDPFSNNTPSFVIFALPAAMIGVCMLLFCYAAVVSTKARGEIQSVCTSTSQRQPRLSFHVRYERSYSSYHSHHHHGHHHHSSRTTQYIEVSIDQNQVTIPIGTATEADIMLGTTNVTTSTGAGTSAADRLAELENVRHLLSPAEYDAKRAEIVSQL